MLDTEATLRLDYPTGGTSLAAPNVFESKRSSRKGGKKAQKDGRCHSDANNLETTG